MPAVDATVQLDERTLRVDFDEPLEGIAPGQAVVCYREDIVVGGGVIACAS
jgi:tRNA U34 2-thiouridine synthase MnmA/TrmU